MPFVKSFASRPLTFIMGYTFDTPNPLDDTGRLSVLRVHEGGTGTQVLVLVEVQSASSNSWQVVLRTSYLSCFTNSVN